MNPYHNLTEALEGLICQGYNKNFVLKKDCLKVRNGKEKISLNDFQVQQMYHFDDPDPKFKAIIYGVSCKKDGIKGLLVTDQDILSKNHSQEIENKFEQKSIL